MDIVDKTAGMPRDDSHLERINRFLARRGVASRRGADQLIADGRVRVNGRIVEKPGARVDPGRDRVEVDQRPIRAEETKRTVLLNKPRGVVTTVTDPKTQKTLDPWLRRYGERLYPVGRLDRDSEGLLLLTNDGDLTHFLTHPRYHIEKEYRTTVRGKLTADAARRLSEGIDLEEDRTQPAEVSKIDVGSDRTRFTIVLQEGRSRQIRRMCEALGFEVIRLRRLRVGPLTMAGLKAGQTRELTADEIRRLWQEIRRVNPDVPAPKDRPQSRSGRAAPKRPGKRTRQALSGAPKGKPKGRAGHPASKPSRRKGRRSSR